MTRIRGLKRLATGAILAVLVFGGAIAIVPGMLRTEAVREALRAEIRRTIGLEPELRGGSAFSAFPSSAANFDDVVLRPRAGDPPMLTAPRVSP